jgi:transmembrane sensor
MIWWLSAAGRQTQLEDRAALWAARMLDDQEGHAAGLRRWVGRSQKRAEAYNTARRMALKAGRPSAILFGHEHERANWRAAPRPRSWRGEIGLALACALVVAGLGIVLAFRSGELVTSSAGNKGSTLVLASRVGEIRPVRLSDGTVVVLDTDSMLHVAFTPSSRSARLDRGRARFTVAPDDERPFVVSAGDGTIIGRKPMFDVAMGGTVRVHLLSGAVDVTYPRGSLRPATLRLSAGDAVGYDPVVNDDPPKAAPGRSSDQRWVTGMQTFDDVSVTDIIAEANRYSDTKIQLADPTLGQRQAFMDLDLRDTHQVARNLAIFLGLTVDESKPGLILLKSVR